MRTAHGDDSKPCAGSDQTRSTKFIYRVLGNRGRPEMKTTRPPSGLSHRAPEMEPHEWYGPCDGFGPYGECSICTTHAREFQCFFNFLGWHQWSLGIHIDPQHPHIDIHVLGGFLRIGWYSSRVSERRLQDGRRPRHVRLLGGNPFGISRGGS